MSQTIATPAGKRRSRTPAPAVIAQSGLPAPIADVITRIVKRTRLWRSEQSDVARELVAHFADGIAAGRTSDELVSAFGDPDQAAKLIRAGKRRNRPLWWHAQHRLRQGIVAIFVLLMLACTVNLVGFYTGRPTITRNYVAEMNARTAGVPETSRAWPLYVDAFEQLGDIPADLTIGIKPGDQGWDRMSVFLGEKQSAMATLRLAAAKPALGWQIDSFTDREKKLFKLTDTSVGADIHFPDSPENPALVGILLPHLAYMRNSARVLASDAYDAMSRKDSARASADILAILGTARHADSTDMLICSLVGFAIQALGEEIIQSILIRSPELLDDLSLSSIAHALAAWPNEGKPISFQGERLFWHDTAQRIYTDDGRGNGHITAQGMKAMHAIAVMTDASGKVIPREPRIDSLVALVAADRKTITEKFDQMFDQIETLAATPLWERASMNPRSSIDLQVEKMHSNLLFNARYEPLTILMPALESATLQSEHALQRRDATLTAIALELHRRRTGSLPATLNELVPALMPSLPVDRTDGKPLKYRRTDTAPGYVLYSVGADLEDDNATPPHWRPGQDFRGYGNPANRIPTVRPMHQLAEAMRTGDWGDIPDGDWILFPAPTDN